MLTLCGILGLSSQPYFSISECLVFTPIQSEVRLMNMQLSCERCSRRYGESQTQDISGRTQQADCN